MRLWSSGRLRKGVIAGALACLGWIGVAQAAAPNSTLRFRLPADPETLDWNLAHTSHETHIIMNLMEGLVEEGPDLVPRPALAERWEISPDGRVYTFFLRPGVKWSDGKPLKARDFVDSWIRLLNPKTKSSYASFLFDLENAEAFNSGKIKDPGLVGVKALNDSQLRVTLQRIVPYFLHLPTFWVTFPIRSDIIARHGGKWASPGKMVTLGPYGLTSWTRGKQITLTRNASYFSKEAPPSIETIEAVIERDDKKARALFAEGKIDFLLDATTEDFLRAKSAVEANRVTVVQTPYLATYYMGFNVKTGPLKDVAIRRALSAAVDRENIAAALQGGQVPAKGWIPPGMAGFQAAAPFAPDTLFAARGSLAKAGYADGVGFPKLQLWVEKFDGGEILADFLVKSFRGKLGIDVEPHLAKDTAEYLEAHRSGKAALFVGHWGADYPDPANFFEVFQSGQPSNRTDWASPDYDQQLKIARGTLDLKARLAAYAEAERILLDRDAVILPLFYKHHTALIGPRVQELRISPLNYLFLKNVRFKSQ